MQKICCQQRFSPNIRIFFHFYLSVDAVLKNEFIRVTAIRWIVNAAPRSTVLLNSRNFEFPPSIGYVITYVHILGKCNVGDQTFFCSFFYIVCRIPNPCGCHRRPVCYEKMFLVHLL